MPRLSSWMMLTGAIVIFSGGVLAGWLSPPPPVRNLDPGESIDMELSAEAGDVLLVVINVYDLGPGVCLTAAIQRPSQGSPLSEGPWVPPPGCGHFSRYTRNSLVQQTGIYTVVIRNTGGRAVTIGYYVTATSYAEMALTSWGHPLVLIGSFMLVGGLGVRQLIEVR